MVSSASGWSQRCLGAVSIAVPFLILTAGLMTAVLFAIELGMLPDAAVLVGLFGPAIFAVVFVAVDRRGSVRALLGQYLRFKAPPLVYATALCTVPFLLLITQEATRLVFPELSWDRFAALSIPQMIFIPLISIGEELGWRGYLQPRMRGHFSLPVASLIVGVIWALWHLPGYFFNTGVVDGVSFVWFGIWVVSGAVILGWLYERSASVFVAIVFHTCANASFNMILIMPADTGSSIPFQIFAGLAALLAAGIMLAWSRRAPETRVSAPPA